MGKVISLDEKRKELKQLTKFAFSKKAKKNIAVRFYSLHPELVLLVMENLKELIDIKYTSYGNIEFTGIGREDDTEVTFELSAYCLLHDMLHIDF